MGTTITPRKRSTSNIKSHTSRVSSRTKQTSRSFPTRDSFLLCSCFPDTTQLLTGLSNRGTSDLEGYVSHAKLSSGAAGLRAWSVLHKPLERCSPNKKLICWNSSIQTGILELTYSCEKSNESQWRCRMRSPQTELIFSIF